MAIDEGWRGSAAIAANVVAELNHWDGTFTAGREVTTKFGNDYTTRKYTVKDASGTISGWSDKSDANGQNALIEQFLNGGTPSAVWLYLYVSGSEGYYGQALVEITKSADAGGLITFSGTWEAADEWYHNIT